MNDAELKKVVRDQRDEAQTLLSDGSLVERSVPRDRLLQYISRPNILAILGVRRCGKSVLAHMLLKEKNYGYVNFDDERLIGSGTKDLNRLLEAVYQTYGDIEYLLLDEIHNIPGWELFVNRLRRTKRVILTGSNARMLSGELATHLTGRYIDFHLFPLSFEEYLRLVKAPDDTPGTTRDIARMKGRLEDFLEKGGFPEAHHLGKAIVRRIFSDIIIKDVLRRADVRNSASFEDMARYMVSNSGNEFTYSKLRRTFGLKRVETASRYVSLLRDADIIFSLDRYSSKLKQQMIAPKKVYCIDTGMVEAIGFKVTENRGSILETMVAIELLRRASYRHEPGVSRLFYWKDHYGREVDFVIMKGPSASQLIQVAYDVDEDVRRREVDALVRASSDVSCKDLLVITWDLEEEETVRVDGKRRTIRYVPVWKWSISNELSSKR